MIDWLGDFEVELKLRIDGRNRPDPHAFILWEKVLSSVETEEKSELIKAFNYCQSLNYKHVGLSSEIYFPHVLRVAAMSCFASEFTDIKAGIIGLLHNALEVTSLTPNELTVNFSQEIANAVSLLTVDRSLQWDPQYKENYYKELSNSSKVIRLVKVLDKLDNIFLLHLNPDSAVKKKYRKEIYDYVFPLAKQDSLELYTYLDNLMTYSLKQEGPNYE
jgi:(p)ppGpp synthase/HD superfamily hydrolase